MSNTFTVNIDDEENPLILNHGFMFQPSWILVFSNDGQVASIMPDGDWSYERSLSALTSVEELLMRRAGFFDRGPDEDDD